MVKSFGVWQITDGVGIVGKILPGYEYTIDKDRLWETFDWNTVLLNDWPVHLSENTWMTETMLNDLFDAMAFAQDYFVEEKKPDTKDISWEQTMAYAKKNLVRR